MILKVLRLHLPGSVVEDDQAKGSYDADKGEFIVKLSKVQHGQHFEGLDMINSLINPQKLKPVPNIEILGGENADIKPSQLFEDFDWFLEQEIEAPPDLSLDGPKYGFGNSKSGIFRNLESELPDLLELENPDTTPANQRAALQLTAENAKFSAEHYLADWAEEKQIITLLIQQPMPWQQDENAELSAAEQERFLRLPRRDMLPLDKAESRVALLGVAELVFCWAHEQRSSLGDPGPESARSVRRLSATLSWLRDFHSAKSLAVSCVRRALCVPLYRNWNLALCTLKDTCQLLSKGRVRVLQVLLDLQSMFAQCESHHVLSQLYLEPYSIWLQCVSDQALKSLAAAMEKGIPSKAELGWELEELEHAAKLTMEEETAKELAGQVTSRLTISKSRQLDSDDDSDDDDDDTESSSGDYSCSDDSDVELPSSSPK